MFILLLFNGCFVLSGMTGSEREWAAGHLADSACASALAADMPGDLIIRILLIFNLIPIDSLSHTPSYDWGISPKHQRRLGVIAQATQRGRLAPETRSARRGDFNTDSWEAPHEMGDEPVRFS